MARGRKPIIRIANYNGFRGKDKLVKLKLLAITLLRENGCVMCETCDYMCFNIIDFMRHSKECIIYTYICKTCDKTFDRRGVLKEHLFKGGC